MPPFTSGPSGPANLKGDRPARSSTAGHGNPTKQSFWILLPHVWGLIKPRRGVLLAGFLLMAVNRLCGFALPITPKYLIDDVVTKHQTKLLLPLVLILLGATLIQALTSYCLTQLLSKSSQRMITELRVKVQEHIGRLPVAYYDANKTGVLVSRIMSDVEGVRNLVGTGLVDFAGGIMTAIVALGLLLRVSVSMTGAAAVFLFVFALSLRYAFRTIRPIYRARPKINAEVTGRLTESLGGVRVVKGYHAEEREGQVFQAGVQKLLDNMMQTLNATSLLSASATVLTGIVGATILYLGATKMIAGSLTTGGYFSYNALLIMLIAPVAQVVSLGPMMTEAMAGLERTREVLVENPEDPDPERTVKLGRIDGRVTFEGVDFSYETGKQVLSGVSFDSQPGTVSAFVGPSGAGKSTIIGLIAAFYVPSAGRVLVDGADLAHVRLDSYRTQLGVVLQETFLFDGTIRENVAFARPDAKEEEILAACRIARVDEFADHFEHQYETVVGERGVKLSGGQKQRVSIARAILADPRILILDEATSSLDSESEALIQEGLRFLMRGRTTFVIAHRLSTIRRADQILVVEAGKIIERGTHASLYAEKGRYYDLYTRQHGIETDLFLAPGEGDTRPEDFDGANGDSDPDKPAGATLPDAIRMIRERRT
ncbi:MAG: ABC transporter ATP-binding protein [Candidatus Acidiferrales bacterium]